MARHNKKGRSNGPRFVMLTFPMLESVAYRTLSNSARALLVDVLTLFNGNNNGELYLGVRDAARLLGLADVGAAGRALEELRAHGFLAIVTPGHFAIKERHATVHRLTNEPWNGRAPTNEWRDWRPTPGTAEWTRIERLQGINLRCGKIAQAVLQSYTDAAKRPPSTCASVEEISTARPQSPQFAVSPSGEDCITQVDCQAYGVERASMQACRTARAMARLQLGDELGGQRKLARAARLHESKLSRFLNDENGRRTLTIDELARLNDALDGRAWKAAA
jgi:hypothetical protein